jgi:hypothetical protein
MEPLAIGYALRRSFCQGHAQVNAGKADIEVF